jgi:hypothetical protein
MNAVTPLPLVVSEVRSPQLESIDTAELANAIRMLAADAVD